MLTINVNHMDCSTLAQPSFHSCELRGTGLTYDIIFILNLIDCPCIRVSGNCALAIGFKSATTVACIVCFTGRARFTP